MTNSNFSLGASVWDDESFLRAFEDLSFPADQFHHREHPRVAWVYLKSSDASRAAERMSAGILRFANIMAPRESITTPSLCSGCAW